MANTRKFTGETRIGDMFPEIKTLSGVWVPIKRSNLGGTAGLSRTELVSVAYKVLGGSGHATVPDLELISRVRGKITGATTGDESVPEVTTVPEVPEVPTVSTRNDEAQILNDLRKLLGGGVDMDTLERVVESKVREHVARPTVVKIGEHEPRKIDGPTHFMFETVLRKISARRNLFLTGPAGVGKTTMVGQVAKALGIDFRALQAKPLPQDHEVFGFISPATGRKVEGFCEKLYEQGGVFLIDEFDTGHSSLSTTLNMLLAQDEFDFPCDVNGVRKVRKHKDFVVMATGNTYGQGASMRYVGTNKMNGAGLDRFTFVNIPTDEQLEKAICDGIDPSASAKVIPIVRKARANCDRYALDYMVTPRCAIDMTMFVMAGETLKEAGAGRLFGRGLNSDQEAKLLEGISF